MKREYAVYKEGVTDNDQMDWLDDWEGVFERATEIANDLEDGETLYLSMVDEGDFEDFPLEFRKEDGIVCQYKGDAYLVF